MTRSAIVVIGMEMGSSTSGASASMHSLNESTKEDMPTLHTSEMGEIEASGWKKKSIFAYARSVKVMMPCFTSL